MTLLREALGQVIRTEREKQNRSLRVIAKNSFMSLGYLSELERGLKEVSSEVLDNICRALNISTSELLVATAFSMDRSLELELSELIEKEGSVQV